MGGFKRIAEEASHTPPKTTDGFLAEVLEAVHTEADGDSFLAVLSVLLRQAGYPEEASKIFRYPSIFCPCVTHETRLPKWKTDRW